MLPAHLLGLATICVAVAASLVDRAAAEWRYFGCYADDVNNRTLTHPSYADYDTQSIETCTSYCAANNFNFAGLEYSTQCFCDYSLAYSAETPDTDCSMQCAGNSTQTCGGPNRLSIYSTNATANVPSTNPGPNGWKLLGCYTDSVDARTLNSAQDVAVGQAGMAVSQCAATCQAGGYTYSGVEFGEECFCDSVVRSTGVLASNGCDMPCAGNGSEYCGGSGRINVYQSGSTGVPDGGSGSPPLGWSDMGCYTDNGVNRTLATQQEVAGGYTNMTVEGCLRVCSSNGFGIGGLEYSKECWCGGTILGGAGCASDQTTCFMPCKGNQAENCGGPNSLHLFSSGTGTAVSSCAVSVTNSASSSTSTFSRSSLTTSSFASISSSANITSSLSSSSSSTAPSSSSPVSSSSSIGQPTTSSMLASSSTSIASITTSASASTKTSSTTSTLSTGTSCSTPSPTSTVCPAFWTTVVSDLANSMQSGGQCTDMASAATRYAFHDAGAYSSKLPFYCPAGGGADGSLLLSATEITRSDNNGLGDYHNNLTQKYNAYKAAGYAIGAADLIQVAGALAVRACPGGQFGRVLVGRQDTTVPAPIGLLPVAFGTGSDHDTILQMFQDKGFSARDLAALIGAHSTSKANFETANGIPAGTPQDTTPGQWDVLYYNETLNGATGIGRFQSDINLGRNESSAVGKQFQSFIGAQAAWGASFSSAYQALSVLGVPRNVKNNLVDCTAVVSGAVFPP